ncbi:fructosamine kinase family protein [Streptomyces sp. NPDC055681]
MGLGGSGCPVLVIEHDMRFIFNRCDRVPVQGEKLAEGRGDGTSVFVKAFGEPPSGDAFAAEAEGLTVLRKADGVATPEIILADRDLLLLFVLRPPPGKAFWEQLAHALAHLHTTARYPRFGWHRDNWLGRRLQVNI